MAREHRVQPVVLVLVDDEDAEVRVRLSLERGQESSELRGAAECRDDEIE